MKWAWVGLGLFTASAGVQIYFFYLLIQYLDVVQKLLGGGCLE